MVLNVFALSEIIVSGKPLLAVNLLNALMNVGVSKDSTNSKWTARVVLQVKRQMYNLIVLCPVRSLVINGPAKSTPAAVKGAESETLSTGRSGVKLNLKGEPSSFWQIVHLRMYFLTSSLPRRTQYFCLKQFNVSPIPSWNTKLWASPTTNSEYKFRAGSVEKIKLIYFRWYCFTALVRLA